MQKRERNGTITQGHVFICPFFFKVYLQTFEGKFKLCCWANLCISFIKQGVWLLSTSIKWLYFGNSQILSGLHWNQSSRFLIRITSDSGSFLISSPFYLHIWVLLNINICTLRFFIPFNLILACVILSNSSGRTFLNALLFLLTASASHRWHS